MDAAEGRMHCDRLHADIPLATCVARQKNAVKYAGKPRRMGDKKIVDPLCADCEQGKEAKLASKGLAGVMKEAAAEIEAEKTQHSGPGRGPGGKARGKAGRPRKSEATKATAKPDAPRTCKACEAVKKAADFYRKKSTADGYDVVCKECRRAQQKKTDADRRQKPPEKPAPAEKECTLCGLVQPIEEFHRRVGSPDGHRAQCRTCRNVEESGRKMEQRGRVIIDFSKHPEMYRRLRALSETEYRRPDQQILWLLANHPRFEEETADGR